MFKINRIARNFLSIGFANIISQVLTFLIGTYYARILGADNFGNISVVQAIMVYFTMVALMGLQTYGTREISKDRNNAASIVGEILSLRFLVSIACYVVILLLASAFNDDPAYSVLFMLYGLTIFPSALNTDWVFIGTENMHFNAVYNILKNLVPFVLILMFLRTRGDANLIPLFTLAGLFAGLVYQGYAYLYKEKLTIRFGISWAKARMYFLYGLPFLLSGILAMINCNVDRIIIKYARSSFEAGIYSSAYYIVLFLTNVITILFVPVFPKLISLFHENKFEALKNLTQGVSKVVVMVCVPCVAGGILLSSEIITLLFGQEYIAAYLPFSILMLYVLLLFVREIYGYGLNAWNRERTYLYIVLASSMFNLLLNLLLTPKYGMNAAAIITVLSEVINLILMKRAAEKILKINVLSDVVKISKPTLVMVISVLTMKYFGVNVILNIIGAAAVYSISILGFKYFTVDEIKAVLIKKKEA